MRIVLLGAPGSGKGTQAKLMAEKYKVPQISTGDILRNAVAEKTEIGKKVSAIMEAGELVSDDIVVDAVTDRLRANESRRGFVLDGFPRNIPQAQELDTRLGWLGRPLQLVLQFALDNEIVIKRVTGRLSCGECGAIYHRHFSRPDRPGVCDKCGSKQLSHRADDNEKTVRARLQTYDQDTAPLNAYYKAQHKLRTIQASGEIEQIFSIICEVVDIEIRPLEKKVTVPRSARPQAVVTKPATSKKAGKKAAAKPTVATVRKATKKVEKKPEANKPVVKKMAKKVAKKTASKVAEKSAVKKPTAATVRKATKKVAKKPTTRKPAAKKVAKKVAKKMAKKVAKKTASKVPKRSALKKPAVKKAVAKKAAKKVAKKATAKKTAKKRPGKKR
jgi:adenylate kinase